MGVPPEPPHDTPYDGQYGAPYGPGDGPPHEAPEDEAPAAPSHTLRNAILIALLVVVGCCCAGFGCSLGDDISNILR